MAMTLSEAITAIDSMLVEGSFGSAGSRVIIEEFLEGEEASFFALVDGETALALESAQDHKRVGDGDTGPNTGNCSDLEIIFLGLILDLLFALFVSISIGARISDL